MLRKVTIKETTSCSCCCGPPELHEGLRPDRGYLNGLAFPLDIPRGGHDLRFAVFALKQVVYEEGAHVAISFWRVLHHAGEDEINVSSGWLRTQPVVDPDAGEGFAILVAFDDVLQECVNIR